MAIIIQSLVFGDRFKQKTVYFDVFKYVGEYQYVLFPNTGDLNKLSNGVTIPTIVESVLDGEHTGIYVFQFNDSDFDDDVTFVAKIQGMNGVSISGVLHAPVTKQVIPTQRDVTGNIIESETFLKKKNGRIIRTLAENIEYTGGLMTEYEEQQT